MTRGEMQKLIDISEKTPEEMRIIAESYLSGDILRDKVAAEAWFNKVIETGDNDSSILAMLQLAGKIWGKEMIVSEKDYEDMKKDGEKGRRYLELLRMKK